AIAGSPEDTASYNVNIGPSNEAPTGINLDNSSVADSASGAIVGTVTAVDPDAGDLHTWTVDDARFEIVAGQLKLKTTQSLDFDTEPTVNVTVRATDLGGLFRDASFVLTVNARESSSVPLLPSGLLPDASKQADTTSSASDSEEDASQEKSSDSDGDKNAIVSGIVTSKNADDEDDDKQNIVMPTTVEDTYTSSTVAQSSDPAALAAILGQDGSDFDSQNSQNEENRQGTKSSVSRSGVLDTQSESTQSQLNYILLTQPGAMWNELDQHRNQLESQIQGDLIVVGATGAAASSVTVGVIAWALRSGVLASGLLAQMPAWRAVDPLLIMQGSGDTSDSESLEELMARRSEALDNEPNNQSDRT
ncbi:MAG: cadherin repeat domain-containing protein, partial [Rubripirellula sp.]